MALAQEYGTRLYTGVFYRDPDPPPTFEDGARERHEALRASAPARHHILDAFLPRGDEGGLETAPS
jgi:2-oxoglutarate ferredoxin oxidoreductase subunit beta